MLVNLSDVFTSQIGEESKEIPLEMTVYQDGLQEYPSLEKTPVSVTFTNIGVGKVSVKGNARVVLQMQCDRCLKEGNSRLTFNLK